MNSKLNIGILGIGAIGSVISFSLNKNHNIFYFNRSPRSELYVKHEEIINKQSITLTAVQDAQKLDWLFICIKEYHISAALNTVNELIHPQITIAVFQNGLQLKTPYDNFISPDHIVECIVDCPTELSSVGFYLQRKQLAITLNEDENIKGLDLIFDPATTTINKVVNFHTAKWEKLIESSALGGLLCLADDSCRIFKNEKMLRMYESLIDESILVAKADGATILPSYKTDMINKLLAYPDTKTSSMLLDQRKGKPLEIKVKNGAISYLGKKYNIPTPLNDLICSVLS